MSNVCSVSVALPPLTWQPSLLAGSGPAGGCRADTGFTSLRRTRLDPGAWLDHAPGWLAGADELFEMLRGAAPWRARTVAMYGRLVAEPRLSAWWGSDPDARTLPAPLGSIARALSDHYGVTFDSIAAALYRDGSDSVAMHSDRRSERAPGSPIAIISLGEPRRFVLARKDGGATQRIQLHAGDLLVMGGTCQQGWEHGIPKTAHAGPRISLQLRCGVGELS